MLSAISYGQPDRVPLYFATFGRIQLPGYLSSGEVDWRVRLGLDTMLDVSAPWGMHPGVRIRSWREEPSAGEPYPLLYKEYETPAGVLRQVVRKADDYLGEGWPRQEDEVQLFSDFNVPRYKEPAVSVPDDLPKLRYLLREPTGEQLSEFRKVMARAKELSRSQGIILAGWGVCGSDAAIWLCGVENAVLAAIDSPDFFEELLEIIHVWDKRRCELLLEEGVDLLVRRGWYDTTDIWSPALYNRFIAPRLKELVDMTHQADTYFGYTMSTGIMPLLDIFKEIGIDVLYHVDPVQGAADLKVVKQKLGGQIAVLGGMNSAVTLGRGSRDEIRNAVYQAVEILAPGGGFILSPVDCLFPDTPWESIETVIEAWREICEYE